MPGLPLVGSTRHPRRGGSREAAVASSVLAAAAVLVAAAVASPPPPRPSSPNRSEAAPTGSAGRPDGTNGSTTRTASTLPPRSASGRAGSYSNLLLRTLVGYNHVAGAAGQELVPDLAVRVPAPTNGGRTYTFRLKRGIRFGPPVEPRDHLERHPLRDRAARAAARTAPCTRSPSATSRGSTPTARAKARSISGISTPNARTIAFTLDPAGRRLPPPPRAAGGRPDPAGGGQVLRGQARRSTDRDLVSSGPYMIEGAGAMSIRSCSALRPMRGISRTQLMLVRNPRYDPRTDSTAARETNPDRFVFVADLEHRVQSAQAAEAASRLAAGELEDAYQPSFWPFSSASTRRTRAKRGRLRVNSWGESLYISMNLTQPPFDDVHVRRAMRLDHRRGGPAGGVRRAAGRPDRPAHHPGRAARRRAARGSRRSGRRGDHGDLARAKAEMAKSKYAAKDGVCVAKACKGVRIALGRSVRAVAAHAPDRQGERRARSASSSSTGAGPRNVPASNNPVLVNVAVGDALARPVELLRPATSRGGASVRTTTSTTRSLGLTPAQAARLEREGRRQARAERRRRHRPVQRARRRRSRPAATRRSTGKLTSEIVPVDPVPVAQLRSRSSGRRSRSGSSTSPPGTTAFAHVAVKR